MTLPTTDETIITRRHQVEGSSYPLPTSPGLGIEVNEAVLREQTFKPWEPPRLWRSDGSYTNW